MRPCRDPHSSYDINQSWYYNYHWSIIDPRVRQYSWNINITALYHHLFLFICYMNRLCLQCLKCLVNVNVRWFTQCMSTLSGIYQAMLTYAEKKAPRWQDGQVPVHCTGIHKILPWATQCPDLIFHININLDVVFVYSYKNYFKFNQDGRTMTSLIDCQHSW